MAQRFLLLNGPNLNRLGKREPEVYGSQTLADVETEVRELAQQLGVEVDARQSNHEGFLIDWIGAAQDEGFSGIAINPGAYTHTSWAIFDAIKAAGVPVVEVHISNPAAREEFRHHSCVAPACVGTVAGFGTLSYRLALRALVEHTRARP